MAVSLRYTIIANNFCPLKRALYLKNSRDYQVDVKLFDKVKNGEVTSTDEFQVPSIRRGTDDSEKYGIYSSLLNMISEGYLEGEKSEDGCLGPNYRGLRVTRDGLDVWKFWTIPISQIGKPTLWEVFRNGLLSAFAGKVALWLVGGIVLILIPTFNEDARELLVYFANWLRGLAK